jgi:uncharacterized protein YkwD
MARFSRRRAHHAASRARGAVTAALILTAALSLTAAAPAAAAPCPDQDLLLTASNGPKIRAAVRCLMDKERTKRGLKKLTANRELRRAGDRYSRLMVKEKFISHKSPGGSTVESRVRKTAYRLGPGKWLLGENLGWGANEGGSPASLIKAWMASPVHRVHVLDGRFRDVGIGTAVGTPVRDAAVGTTYAVEFGRRY